MNQFIVCELFLSPNVKCKPYLYMTLDLSGQSGHSLPGIESGWVEVYDKMIDTPSRARKV